MQASFNSYEHTILKQVSQALGVPVNKNCQELQFAIPAKAGDGHISYFRFHDGFSIFLFDGKVHQDWEWQFQCEQASPLYMFYPISGTLEDIKYQEGKRFHLKPMETLMVVQPGGSNRSIVFKAGRRIKVAVLSLVKENYLEHKNCCLDNLSPEMQKMFAVEGSEVKAFFPPDRATLQSSLLVHEILDCKFSGLMRSCFVEAKARELLLFSLQRTQMESLQQDDFDRFKNPNLEKVAKAREILLKDLKNAPTIEELSRKVGLNRQQLKTDFKAVYGTTIFQLLSAERMNTAKYLLMRGGLSIREVARQVGYENASHFSRRFQSFFNVLPSEFAASFGNDGKEN